MEPTADNHGDALLHAHARHLTGMRQADGHLHRAGALERHLRADQGGSRPRRRRRQLGRKERSGVWGVFHLQMCLILAGVNGTSECLVLDRRYTINLITGAKKGQSKYVKVFSWILPSG